MIHMAAQTGLPFSVFSLDTGRLHPETLAYLETIRKHYDLDLEVISPEREEVGKSRALEGLIQFFEEGHQECCSIRKVRPLRRTLSTHLAWMTGAASRSGILRRGENSLA